MSDEPGSGPRASQSEGPGGLSRVSNEREAQALCEEILRPDRLYPIVGLSCQFRSRHPPMSPDRVRDVLWDTVPIYIIESREARLLEGYLDGMGAYNGACRIWFPGVDPDSEKRWHPLIYDSTGSYGEEAIQRLAAVFAHRPLESDEQLSPEERTVLQLRSLPRPDSHKGQPPAPVIPLSTRKDLRRLTSDLRNADRDYPVVVLTLGDSADGPAFPPLAIRSRIDPHIPIYVLGTADLCRRLAQSLGEQLAVDGGDARVLWPGAREGSDPADHPLVAKTADGADPADRLVAALELSRPGVREHVAGLKQRLVRAEQQATGTLRELQDGRAERGDLLVRAELAEEARDAAEDKLTALHAADLDPAELELIARMDTDRRLHRLISREWLKALTAAADRTAYPLRYVFGSRFIESVDELTGTPLHRIAWVAAMVACGRARDLPGIDPHQLREGRAGSADQMVRADGAKAWRCKLNGEGASRLHYWVRPDGLIEFAAVGVHDAIGQVA